MHILVTKSSPVLPFSADNLTARDEQKILANSPVIDLRMQPTEQEVFSFIQALFSYYFQISKEIITRQSSLLDDIEKAAWARELEIPVEEVTYGRILCSKDQQGNMVGGLSDKGLLMTSLFMFDLSSALGIHKVADASKATFEVRQDEFKSYADCHTVQDLVDLIGQVIEKLESIDCKKPD